MRSETVIVREVTRFGSPTLPVRAAGAVLRARAEAGGVSLLWVSPVELAAAVLAADAWMALTGAESLEFPQRYGDAPLRVLSAVLARASGSGGPPAEVSSLECASSADLLSLAEEHALWAEELCPGRSAELFALAASDLLAAGPGSAFASYAALLTALTATA